MSRSAQSGLIAFGPQVSKGVMPGTPTWYKYRANDIDFGVAEPGGMLPPEIQGIMTPTGAYKTGVFAAGGMTLIPRLDADIGWLLYGLLGSVTSTESPASSSKYNHVFKMATDPAILPWFSIRKLIPGNPVMYELTQDCKIGRVRFTIPQVGPASMRVDTVGRQPTFPEAPSWTFDSVDSTMAFPVSGSPGAFIKLPTFSASSIAATGCIVEFNNMMTSPQQEMVIGSYYPDDFATLQRVATIRFVYKWEDPALTRSIMTGASSGNVNWSPDVYTTDFQAKVLTADATLLGGDEAFSLQFDAANVAWEPAGPIRLVGNNILAQEFVGTVLEPDSGDYFKVTLRNAATA